MPIRIVTTHLEFEGEIEEKRVVMEGEEPPVWGEDAELLIVGKSTPRVDARERVSGAARFSYDVQLPGLLYSATLRSPHPHARVIRVDATRAEALRGVHAVFHHFNTGELIDPGRNRQVFAEELLFAGDLVALIVAETSEIADDALRLIEAEYEPLPFVTDAEAALASDAPRVNSESDNNLISGDYPSTYARGDVAGD